MKRREVLKTLLIAPLAGVISGCQKRIPRPLSFHALRVILQGPFVVVVHANDRSRITAYVPFDEEKLHQFRFHNPAETVSGPPSYQFELPTRGLKAPQRPPYIDRCFDDATVQIRNWKPNPSDYFVSIELPTPDLITFMPPATPVRFTSGTSGSMPANHVLEYRVDDHDDVRLHSPQLGSRRPLACAELYKHYEDYRSEYEARHKSMIPSEKMSPHRNQPEWCSYNNISTFFLGVGLAPNAPMIDYEKHALNFFNQKLLPSLHDNRVLAEKRLASLGGYISDDPKDIPAPKLKGAVLRSSEQYPQARLLTVSAVEDCRAPGLIANSIGS